MANEELKSKVKGLVQSQIHELIELSLKIYNNPELGFQEEKAASWLTSYLEKSEFQVEKGICNLSTSFKATYGSGKPVIALLAEYDALPEIGHGCGHNIIATSSVGAGVASKVVVDNCGGTVLVLGTPAEELFGGKVIMLQNGVFDDIDVAMMVHPGRRNMATTQSIACIGLDIQFLGRSAHAAAHPEDGINALEAMILAFTGINSLRQHIKDGSRIHGIITHGGEAANIVPAHSSAKFLVRASNMEYLEELKKKVLNCFSAAAAATGSQLEHKWGEITYAPMNSNLPLAQLFSQNMESLGRKMEPFRPGSNFGSTDMGNVSQVVPAIHPTVAIASKDISLHSIEFAKASASEAGHKGLLDASQALAMTVVDLFSQPEALAEVKKVFCHKP